MVTIPINRLQHTGVPVTDLERSVSFYESLGFTKVMERSFPYPGGMGKVAMMEQSEIILELYLLDGADLEEVSRRSNGHFDHIAFDSQDIDYAFTKLKQAGFNIVEPAPIYLPFWTHGCRYFNILGPDLERIEFNQILHEPFTCPPHEASALPLESGAKKSNMKS